MNLSEFKAWFEGFSEGIDKTPSAKQWAKINEKISAITPEPTKIEYIREYYDRYRPWFGYYPYPQTYLGGVSLMCGNSAEAKLVAAAAPDLSNVKSLTTSFGSPDEFTAQAFKAMGRADFASEAA